MRISVPFKVSVLSLMIAVVVPLSAILLGLGWSAASTLERDNIDVRIGALEAGVAERINRSIRVFMAVGTTLRESSTFAAKDDAIRDDERARQLAAVLGQYPGMVAAYVGYGDRRLIYVGQAAALDPVLATQMGAPPGRSMLVRKLGLDDGNQREATYFIAANKDRTPERIRTIDEDPRASLWYRKATSAGAPALTEPYRLDVNGRPGVSVVVPLANAEGVIGFDFTLEAMAGIISSYKLTTNALVVVTTAAGNVIAESRPCNAQEAGCRPVDVGVREALLREIQHRKGQRTEREVEIGGHAHILRLSTVPPVFGLSFIVASAVPVAEISAASRTLMLRAGATGFVAVLLAILGGLWVSLLMSRSIARITAKTERIRDLDFSDQAPVRSKITEVLRLSDAVERMREGLQVFGRYVSKDLVRQVMSTQGDTAVGGVRREMTVMFTDIERFSRIGEGMAPELLTSRLSRYFEAVGKPISSHRGTIDKYIGDSIMAFWNAPMTDADHVENACRAALAAASASRALAAKWHALGRPVFRTRFGLHTGPAVVGNVGTRDRINYTLVGAVANQASRLEGLNKAYGTEILASGDVVQKTFGKFVWRHVDRVVPAGTSETVDIHELLPSPGGDDFDAFLAAWDLARADYAAGRFAAALHGFTEAERLRAGDGPCGVFIARCRTLAEGNGVPGWDGIWHFDVK